MLRILFSLLLFASHPVHVTLLSVDYSAEDHSFNAFLKVYFDDFLLDYKLCTGSQDKPDPVGMPEEAKRKISGYLNERIIFMAGKKRLEAEIADLSLSENELRMNLRYTLKTRASSYSVRNRILTDIYKDQSNLLIFKCGNFEEGVKLTAENMEHVFNVK
ncbi:MAG TPA: DUF6702 family protein [Bacteroidales bacterium]|nr:DUF6702 family protein [Bacteroidales bacterium]